MDSLRFIKFLLLGLLFFLLTACSGGGGDDGVDGSGLSGVAAKGAPVGLAKVTIKDVNGKKYTTETDALGAYHVSPENMKNLRGPFTIKVEVSPSESMFSLATEKGHANITPLSDIASRNWFKSRGRDIELEHENNNPFSNPPVKQEFENLKTAIKNLFLVAYDEFSVPPGFDFIKHKFDADHEGFDRLLDHVHVVINNNKIIVKIRDPKYGFKGIIIFEFDLSDDLSQEDLELPTDPSNLVAVPASTTDMILVWNTSTDNVGVAGYNIYRDGNKIAETPFPVYIDSDLVAGVEYCYEVEAFDGSGNVSQNRSNEKCNNTLQQPDVTAPSMPTSLLAIVQSESEIELDWQPSPEDDVLGYHIYRAVSGGAFERIATTVASSYNDEYLDAGVTYCYKVQAFDAVPNLSEFSSETCETTFDDSTKPEAPVVNPVTPLTNESSITVTGLAEAGQEVSVSGGAETASATASAMGTFSVDVPLTLNTENSLTVFVTDSAQNVSPPVSVDSNGDPLLVLQDSTAPFVTVSDPQDGTPEVSLNKTVSVTFSESIKSESVNVANIRLKKGVAVVEASLGRNGNQVTITPDAALDAVSTYTIEVIAAGIQDEAGNTMVANFSASFDTTDDNGAPVANAGDDRSVNKGVTAFLDGSASYDPDGDAITYLWSVVSAPGGTGVTLTNPGSSSPSFLPSISGQYTFQLITNDGSLNSAASQVVITAVNTAPVASAGPDLNGVPLAQVVNLSGAASSDVNNDPLTYQWTMTSRPSGSTATISNPTSVTPSFVPDMRGSYTIVLVVNDGEASSNPDQLVVTVQNTAPVANAGIDQIVSLQETVTIDGSGSSDTDNDDLTYSWSLLDSPPQSTLVLPTDPGGTFDIVPDVAGTYTIQLIVNDGFVNSNPDVVVIEVEGIGTPNANAGPDQRVGVGDTVTLDGSASSDPENDPINFTWTILSSPDNSAASLTGADTASPTFVADKAGDYTIQLVVDDGTNFSDPDTVVITAGLMCGTMVSETIDQAGEADLYTFIGTSGHQIALSLVETGGFGSAPDPRLTLFSPTSAQVGSYYDAHTSPLFTLQENGQYTVRIQANDLVTTGSYNLQLVCLTPPSPVVANLAAGDLVQGSIDVAGETKLYTFNGTAGDLISISMIELGGFGSTPDPRYWLYSPTGTYISYNDAHSSSTYTLSETGMYTIRVMANDLVSLGTFNIGYEVLSEAQAVTGTLNPGDLVTGELTEIGQTELYTFDGNSGDTITITMVELSGFGSAPDPRFWLYTPSGVYVTYNDAHSSPVINLTETGTYTIRVMANDLISTGSFNLGYEVLSTAQAVTGTLSPGDLVTGQLTEIGQTELYTFDGTAGDTITITMIELSGFGSTPDPRFWLYTPSGVYVTYNDAHSSPVINLTETGTYTIRVMANDLISTGSFNLGYEVLSPAQAITDTLVPGDLVSGSITQMGQTELYTFNGNAGDTITISMIELSGFGAAPDPRFWLYTPSGVYVTYNDAHSSPVIDLTETGTYTIRVMANDLVSTGTFSIGYEVLSPTQAVTGTLNPGDLVTGSLTEAGQTELYTFEGNAGDTITITMVELSGFGSTPDPRFWLYTPSGVYVTYNDAHSSPVINLTETGTYTIRVMANDLVSTGTFSLGYEVLSPAQAVTANLSPGDLIAGAITEAGQTELYTFSGNAGDTITISMIELSGFGAAPDPRFWLYTPSGVYVTYNDAHSSPVINLTETGVYTVRVMANDLVSTGTFNIGYEVLSPAQSVTGTLNFGDILNGSIDEVGETELYTFDATAGQNIQINIVELSGFGTTPDPRFWLYTPSGVYVTYNDANSTSQITASETGTYTIRVMANDLVSTGTFSIGITLLP